MNGKIRIKIIYQDGSVVYNKGPMNSIAVLADLAESAVEKYHKNRPHLARFITEVIAQDPRPAYQQGKETDRIYGISLYEFNIKWRIKAGTTDCVEILDIQKLKEQKS